jgi:hypothetical protein
MMNRQWQAAAIVLLSVVLSIGWTWLKNKGVDDRSWQKLEGQWPGHTARFFYFVGLPYLTLVGGILTPGLLGLKGLENFTLVDLSGASAIPQQLAAEIQYALVLVFVEWLVDSRATIMAGLAVLVILGGVRLALARAGLGPAPGPRLSVLDVLYHGLHWAFYRAILWLMTGDLYLATILGAGLVMVEWSLIAWLQEEQPAQKQRRLLNTIILISTGAVFFYSPNLWLLWPVHLAMVILFRNGT